jgi:hypothetical protein
VYGAGTDMVSQPVVAVVFRFHCFDTSRSNPSSNACTNLDEWYIWSGFHEYYSNNDTSILSDLGLNTIQEVTAAMILEAFQEGSVWNVINQLGDKALIASSYLSAEEVYWSPVLPDNQWQIEVANWFSVGLAQIQRIFIANFRPPTEPLLLEYFQYFPQEATKEQVFCKSQKVQDAAYTNFSVLGLALDFGIGGLLLICGHGLPLLVIWIQKKRSSKKGSRRSVARDHWIGDGAIQLQRMVFELLNRGHWHEIEDNVPVTSDDEPLEAPALHLQSDNSSHRSRPQVRSGYRPGSDRSVSEQLLLQDRHSHGG